MFGQLTSARNRGGYVVFTDYKACMCSYGISLNDRIKSWLFIVNNGMGIQITSISPKKCWYYYETGNKLTCGSLDKYKLTLEQTKLIVNSFALMMNLKFKWIKRSTNSIVSILNSSVLNRLWETIFSKYISFIKFSHFKLTKWYWIWQLTRNQKVDLFPLWGRNSR